MNKEIRNELKDIAVMFVALAVLYMLAVLIAVFCELIGVSL